jgi:hypothetical protein
MAYKLLPQVTAFAVLAGATALANCSSHPSNASTGGSSSSSGTATGGGPSEFQADPPAVYVAKVKNILIGKAPTDAEIQQVEKDPTQLKTLIDTWMTDPAYDAKMRVFFELAFQQTQLTSASFIDMVLPNGLGPGEGVPLLVQNVAESFARTVEELNKQGKPFTEAMTTKSYMMTPPLMEFYAFLDSLHVDDNTKITDNLPGDYQSYPNVKNIVQGTMGLSTVTLQQSTEDPTNPLFLHFYNPDVATLDYTNAGTAAQCNGIDPISYPLNSFILNWIMYGAVYNHKDKAMTGNCGSRGTKGSMLWSASDFSESAWRMVTIRPPTSSAEQTTRFFDIPALRNATELVIRTPRVGFFSTPAFFANWSTNSSNQMRVTLNQALIVALGAAIDGSDTTAVPSNPPDVDTSHAVVGSACYQCHQQLDPARAIFSATWTYPYSQQLDKTQTAQKGQFIFQGVTNTKINTIDDFATTLATHPLFASAWTQKLCYYANSQACDPTDPEFQRVVGVFKSSGYSWTALVRELLASPLTTNAAPTQTTDKSEIVAVSRRDHLCAALNNRLGLVDICGLQVTTPSSLISQIVGGLPSDGYGRGSTIPVLPNDPTLFYRAGLENICGAVSNIVIDNKAPPMGSKQWTSSATPDSAIADFVSMLMAIEPSDPRSTPAQAALKAHFTAAVGQGANDSNALKSTFVLACLAPSAVGIGM